MIRGGGWLLVMSACGRAHFDPLVDVPVADAPLADTAIAQTLFASDGNDLYRIDTPSLAVTHVMALCANLAEVGPIADIAIDHTGALFASGENSPVFYIVDMTTGDCTTLSLPLGQRLFGLEYVPAGVLDVNEVLVGDAEDNSLVRVDPTTAAETVLGTPGALGAQPSGDLAWTGSELLASLDGATTSSLARVDLTTGAATSLGSTAFGSIRGLASMQGTLYAFDSSGEIAVLDPASGASLRVQPTGTGWTGAAVH